MENTEKKQWWIKTEGNYFRMSVNGKRKIIKKGQKFQAYPHEIPVAFRDTIKSLDGEDVSEPTGAPKVSTEEKVDPLKYSIKHRAGAWWDVVNEDGKIINEKAMKKADAEELLESLL